MGFSSRWLVMSSILVLGAGTPLAHAAERAAVVGCAPESLRDAAARGLVASDALADSIARASDVARARELALAPSRTASQALSSAEAVLPWSAPDLGRAQARLARYERAVNDAPSPAQVATEYRHLTGGRDEGLDGVRVADLGGPAADVHVGKVGCDYSTGEIIAIVIGFILAIIPGIILLIVLC